MIYILSMKELDKEKRKEAQRRLFSYAVFEEGWKKDGYEAVDSSFLPDCDCGVEILRSEHGKPYVKENPWYFNLSHSGDYLVLAVERCMVGIDIQEERPVKNPQLIAKRFSEKERMAVESDGVETLYHIWCRKEAYAKCIGSGLTDAVLGMDLTMGVDGYEFVEYPAPIGYQMCLCRKIRIN